jgi:hypothetical protein
MKNQDNIKKLSTALLLLAMLVLAPAAMAASISTDQEDYAPWEIVTISGSGFEPASEMTVTVEWPDGYVDEFYGTADDSGGFTLTYGKEKYEGTFLVTASDSAGNTATTTFTDSVTSVTVTSPTTGTPVTVTSLPATVTVSFSYVTSATGTTTAVADVLGTSASASKTITPGTGSDSIVVTIPTGSSNGSHNVKVTVYNSTDGGANQKNDVQNSAVIVNVTTAPSDTTPPVITPTITGTLGNNGWYTSDVEVTWTVTDDESPITSTTYTPALLPHKVTADTAGTTFTCTATSAGGTSTASVTIKRDATPTVVIINAPVNGAYYKTEDVPAGDYTVVEANPDTVAEDGWSDEEGVHTYTVTATDEAGNVGSASVTYTVDNTPPVVTITAPADGAYYKSSNLLALAYSVVELNPYTVVEEGYSADEGEHTVIVTATDAAGNVGSDSVTYIVDDTPPEITITIPGDAAVYILDQVVLADWEATDALSGVATTTATKEPGEAIDTATVGAKTFAVTATDNAGNTATKTYTYSVVYDFGGFLPPVSLDGRSLFKLGSTIPVKFQLFDAVGNPVSDAVARIQVVQLSNGEPAGEPQDAVSTSAATTGNLFRYDSTGQLYIFNLATKPLSAGSWRIIVNLNDGTSQSIDIGIKK